MFPRRLLFGKYLGKKEKLFHTIHRHWITVQAQMVKIALFGYVVPALVMLFITGLTGPVALMMYGWFFISFCYSLYAFLDWYLDAWLITDVSIIDTRWDGFFKQSSSRIDYESIESVDIEMKGIKQSILNYGKICLVRASNNEIKMNYVHNPQLASTWITRVMQAANSNKNSQNTESLKDLLADIIQEHIKVKSS